MGDRMLCTVGASWGDRNRMITARIDEGAARLTLVGCPQCGEAASIEWQADTEAMLYLKTQCVRRHWFLLPSNMVSEYPAT
jgi:hypothetical protein